MSYTYKIIPNQTQMEQTARPVEYPSDTLHVHRAHTVYSLNTLLIVNTV